MQADSPEPFPIGLLPPGCLVTVLAQLPQGSRVRAALVSRAFRDASLEALAQTGLEAANLTGDSAARLAAFLEASPLGQHLAELKLVGGFDDLQVDLPQLPRLTRLEASRVRVGGWARLHALAELRLELTAFGEGAVAALTPLTGLRRLQLSCLGEPPEPVECFAPLLARASLLTQLELAGIALTGDWAPALASLSGLQQLQELALQGWLGISAAGCCLPALPASLRQLSLAAPPSASAHAMRAPRRPRLAFSPGALPALRALSLRNVLFDAASLAGRSQLSGLTLVSCLAPVDAPECGAALLGTLAGLAGLEQLELAAFTAGTADAEAFAGISASSRLRQLALQSWRLPAGALRAVFAPGRLPHLTQLRLLGVREGAALPASHEPAAGDDWQRCLMSGALGGESPFASDGTALAGVLAGCPGLRELLLIEARGPHNTLQCSAQLGALAGSGVTHLQVQLLDLPAAAQLSRATQLRSLTVSCCPGPEALVPLLQLAGLRRLHCPEQRLSLANTARYGDPSNVPLALAAHLDGWGVLPDACRHALEARAPSTSAPAVAGGAAQSQARLAQARSEVAEAAAAARQAAEACELAAQEVRAAQQRHAAAVEAAAAADLALLVARQRARAVKDEADVLGVLLASCQLAAPEAGADTSSST